MKILVLNAGSSSQKSCLYDFKAEEPPIPSRPLWEADIDWSHRPGLAELKVDYLFDAFKSQQSKPWFDRNTFMGLMRIRGMESNAPSGYAEAFYARKIVLG